MADGEQNFAELGRYSSNMTSNMGGNIEDDPENDDANVLVLDENADQFSEGLDGETEGQNVDPNCEDPMSDNPEEVKSRVK